MKYYKSNNLLIQINPETKIARIKNTIGKNLKAQIELYKGIQDANI